MKVGPKYLSLSLSITNFHIALQKTFRTALQPSDIKYVSSKLLFKVLFLVLKYILVKKETRTQC